jgi:hypothetical protein
LNAIEICEKNAGVAKERTVVDRTVWKAEGERLKQDHPFIARKAAELREVFGEFVGLRIYEKGELKWEWEK